MIAPHQLHLHALVSGIPEPRRSAKVLLMLQAMIDESDSHEIKPRVFVLGGYLASVAQWEKLTDAWQRTLDQSPRLKYFSFKDAFPTSGMPRGVFHGFTEEQRDRRIAQLRGIIEENVHAEFGIAFLVEAFQKAYSWNKRWSKNPYGYAVPTLITELPRHMEELALPKQQIDLIFDNRVIEEPNVMAGWYHAKEIAVPNPPDVFKKIFVNAPAFRSKLDVIALQAADMFVGWVRAGNVADLNGREPLSLPGANRGIRALYLTPTEEQLRDEGEDSRKRSVARGL